MPFFQLFSQNHLLTIIIIFLIAAAFVAMARIPTLNRFVRPASWILAVLMVGHELVWILGAFVLGEWSYTWGLPFQLCDLAIFAVAVTLIRHYQWIWELAYFWGLGGSLQAVLTPDLRVTFPDPIFLKFFMSHGGIVIGVIFLSIGCRRMITRASVIRVFVITNVYALFVGIFNGLFGTNYLYLCAKPSQPSLLDALGSGPFYFLGLEGLFVASLLIYYLPYFLIYKK